MVKNYKPQIDTDNKKTCLSSYVLNKKDENAFNKTWIEEKIQKYNRNLVIETYLVNLKDKVSSDFEYLKEKIYENLIKLNHVGKEIPKPFFKIKKEISNLQENIITLDKFENICIDNGLESKGAVEYLLNDLNLIGSVVFYPDANLCNTIFLNPNWVIESVYAILKKKKFEEKQGKVSGKDIKDVWKKDHSNEEIEKLLNLLFKDKFDICFKLQNSDDEYIIPCFLPDNYPNYNWNSDGSLYFIYRYPFMPMGIIFRLIVRLHDLILSENNSMLMWRSGMIIGTQTAKARIIKENYERWGNEVIRIEVTGKESDKKELINKIRYEMDSINSTFKNACDKMIPCNCTICNSKSDIYDRHFFNYERVHNFLSQQIFKDRCDTGEEVNLVKLLGEVYMKEQEFKENGGEKMNQIISSPTITINNSPNVNVTQTTSQVNTNTISNVIKLKENLSEFKKTFYDFNDELTDKIPDESLKNKLYNIEGDLKTISDDTNNSECESKLRKLGRFLENIGNEDSELNKAIKGSKVLLEHSKKLGKYYNDYVSWIPGLPKVPEFLLK